MKKSGRWVLLGEKKLFTAPGRFSVAIQKLKLPSGKIVDDYYRINFPWSVVVVALTAENKVVMLRQYSRGIGKKSLMLPGGHPKRGEKPLDTAKRELREETGYVSRKWFPLGSAPVHVNQHCGEVYYFFAPGAVGRFNPKSDDLEDGTLLLADAKDIARKIENKKIISMSSITALTLASLSSAPAAKKIPSAFCSAGRKRP